MTSGAIFAGCQLLENHSRIQSPSSLSRLTEEMFGENLANLVWKQNMNHSTLPVLILNQNVSAR